MVSIGNSYISKKADTPQVPLSLIFKLNKDMKLHMDEK